MKNYSFNVFKGIEKGERRHLYNNRYYLRQFEDEIYIHETNSIKMDWVIREISRFNIEDNSGHFPHLYVSFNKTFDLEKRKEGIVKFRNLNILEKLIFRRKLENCDKKK